MLEKQQKYRIDEDLLHKKNLGRHTLTDIIVSKYSATTSWAGTFYHYTSPEGLLGILRNKHIFFTDCQFLNDYQERLEINNELDCFWSQNRRNYDKEFCQLLSHIRISEYEDTDFTYIDGEEMDSCRYFVMSASKSKDSLNMWKYYAKNGTYNGYNVGLFVPALVDEWIDRETGVAIESGDVIYSSAEKQNKILNEVEKVYEIWCKYKRTEKLDLKVSSDFKAWISYASIFFKNECFASEEEFRFVAIAPKNKLNMLFYVDGQRNVKMYDFRIVNGVAVPYLKMPFCCYNVEECWVIDGIGIAPSQHYDQMVNGLVQLTKSLEYTLPNFKVRKSAIPLRY